ncbi:peptidylprolyl isomerase [Alkalispirochaeta sphaeroplastigenens]|uniref:Peptidyl-prolyl cis-trans isomerase n=1 Tax=Alkalispirochaeta sphaeroplastigenens TaxID=1187066 RepID=A0A2S4K132_9SPIO|nr:peptidylprolyl isomerase [Alkalispirochaeta sphaeroplastigenens]POR05466.1 peptidylprolyl isomerase [Alkalispirochaeta sphaeroplastigenens]
MTIANDSVVTIQYTLRNGEGSVLDSSDETGGLAYLHGHQNIIPGLESALEGKSVGDTVNTTIAPADGYGERQEELVFTVPRDRLPSEEALTPGMQFRAQAAEGQDLVVTLVDVGDEQVTLDGNHPLAGETLVFDVEITDVRAATADELDHGHVHQGPGGVDH